eukprot:4944045-Amphidinium_carterae.1
MLTTLQCVDCNRQAGKVKATGKHNYAYMRTQNCKHLKTKKVKKRPTGFAAPTEAASSSGGPLAGEATGGLFPWACGVPPGRTGDTVTVVPGVTSATGTVGLGWT